MKFEGFPRVVWHDKWMPADLIGKTARCQESILYGEVQGAFNLVSDFYVLVTPIPAVWALQMPMKKKIGIIAIFMTGLL